MGHLLTVLQKKRIIVQDGFNRVDNASSMGNANTGQLWTPLSGTWGINANTAYCVAEGVVNKNANVIDIGLSNAVIQVKFSTIADSMRLGFRYTDLDNGFIVNALNPYGLYRLQAGTYTQIGSYATVPASGDVIKVVLSGSLIQVYINGVLRMSVTDTFNQTATKHGIGCNNFLTGRWDDYRVEAL